MVWLVLLTVNAAAVAILRTIQAILFAFGEMAIVFGFIDAFALRDIGVMRLIARRLLARHGAVGETLIDARLLIVQPLIDLVHARVAGNLLSAGDGGNQGSAAEAREHERIGSDFHVISSICRFNQIRRAFIAARRPDIKPPCAYKNA